MPLKLEYTDERCIFAGKAYYGIPLLVDSSYKFVEPVCQYLQSLVVFERIKISSVKTYAQAIQTFYKYLEDVNLDWREVDDLALIEWLNRQTTDNVSESTQASRCDVVFAFYVWAELNGMVGGMVRVPGINDTEQFKPRISSRRVRNPAYKRSSKYGVVCSVRPKGGRTAPQPTPNLDQVSLIYQAADNQTNADLVDRNILLIDWYVQVGVRREEWASLTVSQIPDWDSIYKLQANGHVYELRLTVTKGERGKTRLIGVLPSVLEKTREYIEGPRAELVRRFKASKNGRYVEPDEIFLSNKTGRKISLNALSNMLRAWFDISKVEGHGHRLRATYLTQLFEAEIAVEEAKLAANPSFKLRIDYELILLKVAERAGHSRVDSLRSYLTTARKKRVRNDYVYDLVTLQQQIDAKRMELTLLEARIIQLK